MLTYFEYNQIVLKLCNPILEIIFDEIIHIALMVYPVKFVLFLLTRIFCIYE